MQRKSTRQRVPGYCALCWSSCGCISVVEDGKLVAVEADPSHPTGQALCGKGLAAPEYVHSNARLLYPLKRTRPKGDADPGWERVSWDEALEITTRNLLRIRDESGVESVAFSVTTSAGTAMQDGYPFVERLRHAFGTPNAVASIELCDFGKDFMYPHTFGTQMPPCEVDRSDCIVLWGHNPSTTWIAFGTRIAEARRRGARLVVIDPVRVGFAAKADEWLRVRPGTDGALALSMAHVMIEEGLYDDRFVREWTNGPFLVREDSGAFVTGADLTEGGDPRHRIAWDRGADKPARYDTLSGTWVDAIGELALAGTVGLEGAHGVVRCSPAFARYRALCAAFPPARAADITWVDADQIRRAARLVGGSKAVSLSSWAGLEMHSNTSQTARALACLYALTGSFDAPGGNVLMTPSGAASVLGRELMPRTTAEKGLGLESRRLGPESIFNWITTDSLYKAVLEREPYGVNALVSFGLNMLVSHADGERGARALDALDFMVHMDLFMTPTAMHADIVLPVNTPWEREGLKTGFHVDQRACAHVQLRRPVMDSLGESKSDTWIAFELARRLGLGDRFWNGNPDDAYAEILEPTGLTVEQLRAAPRGVTLPRETRYRKFAGDGSGPAPGFATPSKRVEFYSETLLQHGYDPLPDFVEPAMGPGSRPEFVKDFPLVLTDTKSNHYIHSQYRHVAKLRRHEKEPLVEVHPDTAAARGIAEGDWIKLSTPSASVRAKAKFSPSLDPRVVRATVGWWQGCEALGLPGYDAASDVGANLNRLIASGAVDPIGGCEPHKSYLCQVTRVSTR